MKEIFTKTNQEQGFTLVELMIVIAIIGILAAIAVPNFMAYQQKGYDTAAKAEAMSFFQGAMSHLSEQDLAEGANITIGPGNHGDMDLYTENTDIENNGALTMNDQGVITGAVTFYHRKSSDHFFKIDSSGVVSKATANGE
jgi:prepilin-type N-terminal cleavage/methylation domain-containing protein